MLKEEVLSSNTYNVVSYLFGFIRGKISLKLRSQFIKSSFDFDKGKKKSPGLT